ncbi:hypothetical protein BDQ17DRAFT_1326758 [Cyathus striatus]|nr:hypothetical protein BDQ17DRAFT_1326758 [Cyathus striatus]
MWEVGIYCKRRPFERGEGMVLGAWVKRVVPNHWQITPALIFLVAYLSATDAIRLIDQGMESRIVLDFQDTMQRSASGYTLETGFAILGSEAPSTSQSHPDTAPNSYASVPFSTRCNNHTQASGVVLASLRGITGHIKNSALMKEVLDVLIAARNTLCKVLSKVAPEKRPTYAYEEMEEMRYLKAVINETLWLLL